MADPRICSIPDCDKAAAPRRKGMCTSHYYRDRRYGNANGGGTGKGAARRFLEMALSFEDDACLHWPFATAGMGYGYLTRNGRNEYVHRIVCQQHHGKAPSPKHEVAHQCGNHSCVNYRHLRWATHVENEGDKLRHGTTPRGEKHGAAKLTKKDVLTIRASSENNTRLAATYGVHPSYVSLIRNGKRWSWLLTAE